MIEPSEVLSFDSEGSGVKDLGIHPRGSPDVCTNLGRFPPESDCRIAQMIEPSQVLSFDSEGSGVKDLGKRKMNPRKGGDSWHSDREDEYPGR